MSRTLMMIAPHADDAALFCGGTLAKRAREGWNVVVVRVTIDDKDSVALGVEETIERNAAEFAEAARILGVSEIVELGYPSDCLAEVSEVELRERFIRLYREHRPYAVFSFDPYGVLYENNQDHVRIAQAVDEAFWTAMFDKHHPEHLESGLEPHAVCERWYFARRLLEVNRYEDISDLVETKIRAACAHQLMMTHIVHQLWLQTKTWGRSVPEIEQAHQGDYEPVIARIIREQGHRSGGLCGVTAAEPFRVLRFGALDDWFEHAAVDN